MNLKIRARAYVDSGEVRNILYRHLSMNVADLLMDWLVAWLESDTRAPPPATGKFGGHKR